MMNATIDTSAQNVQIDQNAQNAQIEKNNRALFALNLGYTIEQLSEIGLEVTPCTCGKEYCSGYQFSKTEHFNLDTFNRKFS